MRGGWGPCHTWAIALGHAGSMVITRRVWTYCDACGNNMWTTARRLARSHVFLRISGLCSDCADAFALHEDVARRHSVLRCVMFAIAGVRVLHIPFVCNYA